MRKKKIRYPPSLSEKIKSMIRSEKRKNEIK